MCGVTTKISILELFTKPAPHNIFTYAGLSHTHVWSLFTGVYTIHKQYDVNEDRGIWDEYYKQELFGTRKTVVVFVSASSGPTVLKLWFANLKQPGCKKES